MIHFLAAALASSLFLSPSLPADDAAAIQAQLALYPLNTCVASGERLVEADAVNFLVDGQLMRACCNNCVRKVKAEPKKYLTKVQRAIIAKQGKHYPLTTCLKNPSQALEGDGAQGVVASRLVRACCDKCLKGIAAAPADFMKRLDSAYIAQQLPRYSLDTCLVSDEPLGDKPKDLLVGNTLVRVCCGGCKRDLVKDPVGNLRKLAQANKAGREGGDAKHKQGRGRGEDGGDHGGERGGDHGGDHDGDHDGGRGDRRG